MVFEWLGSFSESGFVKSWMWKKFWGRRGRDSFLDSLWSVVFVERIVLFWGCVKVVDVFGVVEGFGDGDVCVSW